MPVSLINQDLLRALGVGNSYAELYAPLLAEACPQWGIDEASEVAAFLANCCHESANFTRLEENLNYSANALRALWPKRVSLELSTQIARKPQEIANTVYANRMGNGDYDSGEGWKYRGRGLAQITGKSNYAALSVDWGYDVVVEPDILLEPDGAVISACWFWRKNDLDQYAHAGDWRGLRRIWNGGDNGMDEVLALVDKACTYLGV